MLRRTCYDVLNITERTEQKVVALVGEGKTLSARIGEERATKDHEQWFQAMSLLTKLPGRRKQAGRNSPSVSQLRNSSTRCEWPASFASGRRVVSLRVEETIEGSTLGNQQLRVVSNDVVDWVTLSDGATSPRPELKSGCRGGDPAKSQSPREVTEV